MTVLYIILILFQAGVIIYFVRRNGKLKKNAYPSSVPQADTYEGHRKQAISVTPEQLQLNIPAHETFVYGVIMDWNTGESVYTLATYINGAANLYISSGGGVKGGGGNPNVGVAAAKFVASAQEYVQSAMPAGISDVPSKGCVRFYLLTNKSLYAAQEQVKNFDSSTSAWLPMFQQGNEVITEMMNNDTYSAN